MLFDDAVLAGKVKKYDPRKGCISVLLTGRYTLEEGCRLLIAEIEGLKVPFRIESREERGRGLLAVRLNEVENESDARPLIGADVFFAPEHAEERESSDTHSPGCMVGYKTYDKTEGFIGTVERVDDSTANTLLYLKGDGEIIIPFNGDFLLKLDHEKRTLLLDLPEGVTSINR